VLRYGVEQCRHPLTIPTHQCIVSSGPPIVKRPTRHSLLCPMHFVLLHAYVPSTQSDSQRTCHVHVDATLFVCAMVRIYCNANTMGCRTR
jgi:hypothetical protein